MENQTPVIILMKWMITIIIFKWFYIIFPIQNSEEPKKDTKEETKRSSREDKRSISRSSEIKYPD